jgi:hypothetical protein
MLSSTAGAIAIVLDFMWSLSEVLKSQLGIDLVTETHVLLLVGFPITFIMLMIAMFKYVGNGYIKKEVVDEIIASKEKTCARKYKKMLNSCKNK